MNRIETILSKVRFELSDEQSTRWSTEGLLGLLSDGQKDIINNANCIFESTVIATEKGKNTYILPENAKVVKKVTLDDQPLQFISRDKIADIMPNWTEATGTPLFVIYDIMNKGLIKIAPVPEDTVYLNVYYIASVSDISSTTDNLYLGKDYDLGLFYYVCYRALFRDFDAQSMTAAAGYLKLYQQEIKRYKKENSHSFVSSGQLYENSYRGFV